MLHKFFDLFRESWDFHKKNINVKRDTYLKDKFNQKALDEWEKAIVKAHEYLNKNPNDIKTLERRNQLIQMGQTIASLHYELSNLTCTERRLNEERRTTHNSLCVITSMVDNIKRHSVGNKL